VKFIVIEQIYCIKKRVIPLILLTLEGRDRR